MIIGEYNYKLDNGGRLTLAKKILEYFGSNDRVFFVTIDNRIFMYNYEKFFELLIGKDFSSISSFTCESNIDAQKRLLIPSNLRENLHDDITLVGDFDKFEIWDRSFYESVIKKERLEYMRQVVETLSGTSYSLKNK